MNALCDYLLFYEIKRDVPTATATIDVDIFLVFLTEDLMCTLYSSFKGLETDFGNLLRKIFWFTFSPQINFIYSETQSTASTLVFLLKIQF